MTTKKVPRKPKKITSKGSATPTQKSLSFLGDDINLSEKCQSLRYVIKNLPPHMESTKVQKGEVFKFNENQEVPIYVTREDVDQFLRMRWLNIPIVQIFMM